LQINDKKRLKKIKLVITDVDGVLTDGGMYYSKDGEFLKKFNTRDAMGMELLLDLGIKTIMLTRENSNIVKARAKKIKVSELYSGILNKKTLLLKKILKKYNVKLDQVAYIGDDLNDLEIMKSVGFSVTPSNGIDQIKKISNYVCKLNGGDGVFRELADIIISSQK
jgi:YrbI family 3-deoxy-D-manno-octulosonate 8-phosphate phosphatase|tara:strand:- start:332 stop:829 length:498 start_codon:yes stop_codon:yes gene_type:complete